MSTQKFNNMFKAFMKKLIRYLICFIIVIAIRILIIYISSKYTNPYNGWYNIVNPGSFSWWLTLFNYLSILIHNFLSSYPINGALCDLLIILNFDPLYWINYLVDCLNWIWEIIKIIYRIKIIGQNQTILCQPFETSTVEYIHVLKENLCLIEERHLGEGWKKVLGQVIRNHTEADMSFKRYKYSLPVAIVYPSIEGKTTWNLEELRFIPKDSDLAIPFKQIWLGAKLPIKTEYITEVVTLIGYSTEMENLLQYEMPENYRLKKNMLLKWKQCSDILNNLA